MEDGIGHRQGHHRIVRKAGELLEQRNVHHFDPAMFINGADDVSGYCTQHIHSLLSAPGGQPPPRLTSPVIPPRQAGKSFPEVTSSSILPVRGFPLRPISPLVLKKVR